MEIKPYPKNYKKHPDSQLKIIARSLKEYGWRQPIVVDKDDIIIVGHGRWMAYKKYPEGIKNDSIKTFLFSRSDATNIATISIKDASTYQEIDFKVILDEN